MVGLGNVDNIAMRANLSQLEQIGIRFKSTIKLANFTGSPQHQLQPLEFQMA
jgi:hypothetical protein